jgi:hypothetical protein
MARKTATAEEITIETLTEEEARVLTLYIDRSEEVGEACAECNSVGEDEEGDSLHSLDCPVKVAIELRTKLGVGPE